MNPAKMEKEPESLAVQMKSDYASSEVYSTAGSEAPPVSVTLKLLEKSFKKIYNKTQNQ